MINQINASARLAVVFICTLGSITINSSCKKYSTGGIASPVSGLSRSANLNQALEVFTVAGNGTGALSNGPAASAQFNGPSGLVMDSSGNIYVADSANHCIRKISANGIVSTFAGNGTPDWLDATGTAARFNTPTGLAITPSGIIYVADKGNNRIRKITPDGTVSTLAGGSSAGGAEGPGASARFRSPYGVAVDKSGKVLVADSGNHRIRIITTSGTVLVSTFTGTGIPGWADGASILAQFRAPMGIAVDTAGFIYVADRDNQRIRKITATGTVSTLAGSSDSGSTDGSGTLARFNFPTGVAVDITGTVYVADRNNHRIRQITPGGAVSTLAGNGAPDYGDGPTGTAKFKFPFGIATDLTGNVLIADKGNNRIRKIAPHIPVVSTLTLTSTYGIVTDAAGNAYSCSFWGNMIQKITPAGVVSTFAGSNENWYHDGPGTTATIWGPYSIDIDAAGNLYVYEYSSHRIRKITPDAFVTTLAGSGPVGWFQGGGFADGPGNAALFGGVGGIDVDAGGIVYVADAYNNRIRKIMPDGMVSTIAGGSTHGYADGPIATALFDFPQDVAVDNAGNIYVSDAGNKRIRKITPAGIVSTVAGSGASSNADGPALSAGFIGPGGLSLDAAGNLYVADMSGRRIRKVSTTGMVTTIAGADPDPIQYYEPVYQDGPGNIARFNFPMDVAVDASGAIYVADYDRIRKIQ